TRRVPLWKLSEPRRSLMSRNNGQKLSGVRPSGIGLVVLFGVTILAAGCGVRFDMQDQPRYKAYKHSDFYGDGRSSRDLPEGTVARGQLRENKGFYTGKIDNPNPNAQAATTTNESGNTIVTSFPNAIDEFPMAVTKELIDRGQDRYNIHC